MSQLEALVNQLNKKYKKEIITEGTRALEYDRIPFSNSRMNYMTYGGMPMGRMIEFFGPEGSGKTTTTLELVGQAQLLYPDKRVVYVDAENTLDERWAQLMGVDVESLIIMRPDDESAEEILQMMIELIETGEVSLMVLDSIPMLVSAQAMSKDMTEKTYCGIAGPMTTFSQKITPILTRTNTCLILINQVRDVLNSMYPQVGTPGGRALKHAYSVRIQFQKGKLLDDKNVEQSNSYETPCGNIVQAKIVKTKVFRPDRKVGAYTLNYFRGIENVYDLIFTGLFLGHIMQRGAWYTIVDKETREILTHNEQELKFNGKTKLMDYLNENPDITEVLNEMIYEDCLKVD